MKKKKLIFIAACPRSGSTLITNLIGNHRNIFNVGEMLNIHSFLNGGRIGLYFEGLCSCTKPVMECSFWGPLISKTIKERDSNIAEFYTRMNDLCTNENNVGRHLLPGKQIKALLKLSRSSLYCSNIARNCYSLLDNIALEHGVTTIVDSSKTLDSLVNYLNYKPDDWDVNIVHIFRDPRATALSNIKGCRRAGVHPPNFYRCMLGIWRQNIMFNKLSTHPSVSSYQRLNFEEFCSDPEEKLKAIGANIAHRLKLEELTKYSSIRHDIAGSRSVVAKKEGIKISLDQTWRKQTNILQRILGGILALMAK